MVACPSLRSNTPAFGDGLHGLVDLWPASWRARHQDRAPKGSAEELVEVHGHGTTLAGSWYHVAGQQLEGSYVVGLPLVGSSFNNTMRQLEGTRERDRGLKGRVGHGLFQSHGGHLAPTPFEGLWGGLAVGAGTGMRGWGRRDACIGRVRMT